MIGFNHIGRLGRRGNQMFQYAALRGIAAQNGYNFCFPFYAKGVDDGLGNMNRTELFDCFEMSSVSSLNIQAIDSERPYLQERSFHFDDKLFNNCPDWISLYGFFQSEKYFSNVKELIRQDFTFKEDIRKPCEEMMGGVYAEGVDPTIVGLHIRRSDYLTNPNHHALDISYYEEALKLFPDDVKVLVFSDDPKWCYQQLLFNNDRFMISENENGHIDQCLMGMCTDFIIANSSFSWWAAWLTDRGKVVAPSEWFGSGNQHLDTKDIYCSNWIVI